MRHVKIIRAVRCPEDELVISVTHCQECEHFTGIELSNGTINCSYMGVPN